MVPGSSRQAFSEMVQSKLVGKLPGETDPQQKARGISDLAVGAPQEHGRNREKGPKKPSDNSMEGLKEICTNRANKAYITPGGTNNRG